MCSMQITANVCERTSLLQISFGHEEIINWIENFLKNSKMVCHSFILKWACHKFRVGFTREKKLIQMFPFIRAYVLVETDKT